MSAKRKLPAVGTPELEVQVSTERSFGTQNGHDEDLKALARYLEYRAAAFLSARKKKGKYHLLVYVSHEK